MNNRLIYHFDNCSGNYSPRRHRGHRELIDPSKRNGIYFEFVFYRIGHE